MSTEDSGRPQRPDQKDIAKTCMEVTQHASRLIGEFFQRQVRQGVARPSDELGIAKAFNDLMAKSLANPFALAQTQAKLAWDHAALWQHTMLRAAGMQTAPVAQPAKDDKRFKNDDWQNHFLFDFIKQSYLINARHIKDSVHNVHGLSEVSRKKVNFFTRQFVDALAPTNFALTNPEVLRETAKSNGQNLLNGFNNLLRDIDGGGQLRVKMTDPNAFELGHNVATTPGKVVFQNDLLQLLQFTPTTEKQFKRPLLIIPPWINKYYILDLRESNSFVKFATDQGHTVFVISWVNPDAKLAQKGFDDYLNEGALAALDAVCEQTGEQEVNLIGYCLGGTLLGATMGYLASKKDKRIASASFFASLLDFSMPGELGVFIDEGQVASLEKKMEKRGYLEGSEMSATFNMLRSNDLIWSFIVNNYLMGKQPYPFDLLYWNSDSTRMPYKMHSFYLRNMYLKNLLKEPGGIELNGVPIDIGKIKAPCYFVSTSEDHISPWQSTYLGAGRLGGPVRFVLGGSGHIAGIVNPPAANRYDYWTNDTKALPAQSDEWLAGAEKHPGSWWNDWQEWIAGLNGKVMVAPRSPGKRKMKSLEDAPGSFAKVRLDLVKKSA